MATLDDDAAATAFTVFAPPTDAFTALVLALKGSDNGASTGITALTSFWPDQVTPVLRHYQAISMICRAALRFMRSSQDGAQCASRAPISVIVMPSRQCFFACCLAWACVNSSAEESSILSVLSTESAFAGQATETYKYADDRSARRKGFTPRRVTAVTQPSSQSLRPMASAE